MNGHPVRALNFQPVNNLRVRRPSSLHHSTGKVGNARNNKSEAPKGKCTAAAGGGQISNGGIAVGAELTLRTKLLRDDNDVRRRSEKGDGEKVLNSICSFCNVEHQV